MPFTAIVSDHFFILIFYGNSDKRSVALFRAEEITMM